MNADGTDNRQITHTPFQENEVTWATDGSKLLFPEQRQRQQPTVRNEPRR